MSVINKMLQDLDKRGASRGGLGGAGGDVQNQARPAPGVWRSQFAAWMLIVPIAIGIMLLGLWLWPESDKEAELHKGQKLAQVKPQPAQSPSAPVAPGGVKPAEGPPRPAESPTAPQSTGAAPGAAPAAPVATAPAQPAATAQVPPAAPAAAPPAATAPAKPAATAPATPVAAVPAAAGPPAGPTSVAPAPAQAGKAATTPPKVAESASAAKSPPKAQPSPAQASVAPAVEPTKPAATGREPKETRRAAESKEGTITLSKRPPASAQVAANEKAAPSGSPKPAEAKLPAPASAPAADAAKAAPSGPDTAKGSISIERPDRDSLRFELAAREFRNAVELMNQGRIEQAIGTYANTLRLDPKHVAARQAMVVLLMERRRVAEAQGVLREGLLALPGHTAWAMLLARIQVEAGDAAGALETLDGALPYAKDRPDYHAFVATLLQMQGRHKEAIAHYEIAVRLSPGSGRWLTGLAISLEEEKRAPEARDAYSRALATRTLDRDLQEFVERKLPQMQ